MAGLARRRRFDGGHDYWPGFVDAMATLLLVFIFLLTVFMLAQFLLTNEISGRDIALTKLRSQIVELNESLALEQADVRSLQASLAGLTDDLSAAESERDIALTKLRSQIAELNESLALEQADVRNLQASLAGLTDDLSSAKSERAGLSSQLAKAKYSASDFEQRIVILQDDIDSESQSRQLVLAELEERQRTIADLRSKSGVDRIALTTLTRERDSANSALEVERQAGLQRETIIVDLRSQSGVDSVALTALIRERDSVNSALEVERQAGLQRETIIVDLRSEAEKERALATSRSSAISELQTEIQKQEQELFSLVAEVAARAQAYEEAQIREFTAREVSRSVRQRIEVVAGKLKQGEAEHLVALAKLKAAQDQVIFIQDESARAVQSMRSKLILSNQRVTEAEVLIEGQRDQTQVIIDLRRTRDKHVQRINSLSGTLSGAKTIRDRALRDIEILSEQLSALHRQISALQDTLDASESRDIEQKVQIANLGRRLNVALAQKVKELSSYRSEFFGRLRKILSDRSDVSVVGDRFVFQSEVLFPSASDIINNAGQEELTKLAEALVSLEAEIPEELNWVLRVDGHTDKRAISSPAFRTNWELSSARAISVVQHLIANGVPPKRLVAAGFGEYQPLDQDETDGAFSRNRRIELKLTER